MKKLNWLDKFAQEMAQKEQQKKEVIKKQASKKTKSREVIVSPKDVPNARNGKVVAYKGKKYRVVQANYRDNKGPGVVLAAYEGMGSDPMSMAMGANPSELQSGASKGQEYAYTKLDIEQTYDFDQDNEWGTSSAQSTADQIAAENSSDRTTVDGYYSRPQAGQSVSIDSAIDPLDGQGAEFEGDFEEEYTEELGNEDELSLDVDDELEVDLDADDPLEGEGDPEFLDEETLDESQISVKSKKGGNDMFGYDDEIENEEELKRQAKINGHVINYTKKLAQAFTEELENSLEYAESVIKRTVPGRYARQVLASLEKSLDKEGLEVEFDKQIPRQQIKKTASERATNKELFEVRNFVNTAISEDTEELLDEAEKLIDEEIAKIAKATKSYGLRKLAEIEGKMKSVMERKLKSVGIHARFVRKYQKRK